MAKKSKLIYDTNDWTFEKLKLVEEAIAEIAFSELKLNIYPNQIEIIGSDQMLDAYSSIGLPLMYHHWSFGKHFILQEKNYRKGLQGLAYEIVINSNPCISYCMEENSMTMQTLVIAHAAYGHNHFFKNNYLFKQWTDADAIIDYLAFAKKFISKCEEDHGPDEVEIILDAAHSLMAHGVHKYRRPSKLNKHKELQRQKERAEEVQKQVNLLWNTLPLKAIPFDVGSDETKFPKEPEENLLYFLEKHSPVLKPWQREIIRIVRKLSQYFYPQQQTKLMNEGFASFVHYYILKRLWEKGQISDGSYMEALHSHSSVLRQLDYKHPHYFGINPYALGFDMFTDIKRICETPTEEDKELFPSFAGTPWLDTILFAVENFRDESFITQFLSPTVIKKWKMFEITNRELDMYVTVSAIQERKHFTDIKETLSKQYSISRIVPDIQIIDANLMKDRKLVLRHTPFCEESLIEPQKEKTLQYIKTLWGYEVEMINEGKTEIEQMMYYG